MPPCLPSVSWLQPSPHFCLPLGLPLPKPVLGGCQTLPISPVALGHSLVSQDDPLDACSKEDNRADICQVVKESQEDTESCLPSQWGAGTLSQPSEAPELICPADPTHPQPHSPGSGEPWRIQTAEVVAIARIVPVGMDF